MSVVKHTLSGPSLGRSDWDCAEYLSRPRIGGDIAGPRRAGVGRDRPLLRGLAGSGVETVRGHAAETRVAVDLVRRVLVGESTRSPSGERAGGRRCAHVVLRLESLVVDARREADGNRHRPACCRIGDSRHGCREVRLGALERVQRGNRRSLVGLRPRLLEGAHLVRVKRGSRRVVGCVAGHVGAPGVNSPLSLIVMVSLEKYVFALTPVSGCCEPIRTTGTMWS